jgi:hypothetical protein
VIDTDTRALLDRATREAFANGRDLGEELDRLGLLLTPQRRQLVVHAALRDMVVTLERVGAAGLMRLKFSRVSGTPADMFAAVLTWLEDYMKVRDK